MSIIKVSTTSQLNTALAFAKSGDSILLASGTYSAINLKNINPSGNVLITSADPQHQAIITDLLVQSCSNLTFSQLALHYPGGAALFPFQVLNSKSIALDHLNVDGPALGSNALATGLIIRQSDGVAVTNSEFSNLKHGIEILDNSHLKIVQNSFHDLRTDGIRGGGDSNVLIGQNSFTSFHPAVGDHPDAIQFWTTNTAAIAHDIIVSGNSVIRGSGSPVQGVFFRDQVGNLPYANVSVNNNIVAGGMYNGIFVSGAADANISKNIVVGFSDQRSWIRADNVSNLVVDANMATFFMLPVAGTPIGNQLIQNASDGGSSSLQFWLTNHQVPGDFAGTAAQFVLSLGLTSVGAVNGGANDHIITITGTDGADRLIADPTFTSYLFGGGGADTLTGNGVGTALHGGAGDDNFVVKSLGDIVIELAGEGNDTVTSYVDYTLAANVESLRLAGDAHVGTGNKLDNRLVGSTGNDTLHGMGGDDAIQGCAGADVIYGDDGNDKLHGDAGADQLWGGVGSDILMGGEGNDLLNGGTGNDVLEGGAGDDKLWGGAGNDIFRFRDDSVFAHDHDEIMDFARGVDLIDLSAIDAKAGTSANDGFTYIGSQSFHHVAGELQVKVFGDGMKVAGDVNGDGIEDFSIIVHGVTNLSLSDFNL